MKFVVLVFVLAFVAMALADDKVKTGKPDYTKVRVVEHADNSGGGHFVPDQAFYRPSDPNATPETDVRPVPGGENPSDKYPYRPNDGVGRNGK